jgi:hypothetical protein
VVKLRKGEVTFRFAKLTKMFPRDVHSTDILNSLSRVALRGRGPMGKTESHISLAASLRRQVSHNEARASPVHSGVYGSGGVLGAVLV